MPLTEQMQAEHATGGAGLRFLSGAITSPTLTEQIQGLLAQYPNARWCQYEPIGRENMRAGAQMAFGADVNTLYHFDKADVIVSLDGDFLLTMPGHVRYAVRFRQAAQRSQGQSRFEPPVCGGKRARPLRARWRNIACACAPVEIEAIARALATGVGYPASGTEDALPLSTLNPQPSPGSLPSSRICRRIEGAAWWWWARRSRRSFTRWRMPSIRRLAMWGRPSPTRSRWKPMWARRRRRCPQLVAEMHGGQVQMLVMLDCNPVYTAPADLNFAAALN